MPSSSILLQGIITEVLTEQKSQLSHGEETLEMGLKERGFLEGLRLSISHTPQGGVCRGFIPKKS